MVRNDNYYLEKIAERWVKEQGGHRPGVTYRLAQLPTGFAGYEKSRDGSKHVDRYLYGHPNGIFRSLNELWPHFTHLQDYGGSVGCPCKLCTGAGKGAKKKTSRSNSISSAKSSERSPHFGRIAKSVPKSSKGSSLLKSSLRDNNPKGLPQGRLESSSPSRVRERTKPADDEGTPDIYRKLLHQLREAGSGTILSENIIDQLSPDWRAGNEHLQKLLTEWQPPAQPSYVPRMGEIVLFARNVSDEAIAWDASAQVLRVVDPGSQTWLDRVKWEAGVVTQMPIDSVTEEDLKSVPPHKRQNVAYTGFRVEPIPEPSNDDKPYTQQHKYVPLHAIRPFSFWKECIGGLQEHKWHPTIKHALTVASSFCLLGRYSFKGLWPEATLFARGVYLGAELIMVGDTVRLAPREPKRPVTDILVVSSIRLRFVNLEQSDYDDGHSYTMCLHICGKTFSLDPKKGSDGIGRTPAIPGEHSLPSTFGKYGNWFHVDSASNERAKLEVPYFRVLGRCFDEPAVKAWFPTPSTPPPSSFQAVNTPANKPKLFDISQGFDAIHEARQYSREHDSRIEKAAGKNWHWAETRIEQLDLHEVNGAFVGDKDETRSKKQFNAWKQALKVLDGKKGGYEEYHAARNQRLEEEKRRESAQVTSSSWGLMGSAAKVDTTDSENGVDGGFDGSAEEG